MSKVIDAKERFANINRMFDEDYDPNEILFTTYGALSLTVEHTMQGILIDVLDMGDDAWLEFGNDIRRSYAETTKD